MLLRGEVMIWVEVFDVILWSLLFRKESVEVFGVMELLVWWSCICGWFRRWLMYEVEVEFIVGG